MAHILTMFRVYYKYGSLFLGVCDFMVGSPTALADESTETALRKAALDGGNGLYVPSGALWGGEDIRKMADRGTLRVHNTRQLRI